jgi:FkbM family methyltransferase
MNKQSNKKRMENTLLAKSGLFIFRLINIITQQLSRFIHLKPKKINRYGKTFIVSGNLKYYIFWRHKSWEEETYRILQRYLDSEHSYIDIGAWIGPTVLYAAQIAKKTYAIEPDPLAFKELEKNVSLNPTFQQKISLHEKCINVTTGKVRFGTPSMGGDTISSLRFGDSENAWIVEGITFDDFIKENTITDCNVIKIDIEGAEAIVIPTMIQYLEKYKPTLHLSMHPEFFNDPKKDTVKIIDVLKIYKYVYFEGEKKIELSDLLSKKRLKRRYTLVATDKIRET